MLVMRTAEDPAYPLGQLVSAQRAVGLDHLALRACTHSASMAFSHGPCFGSRQLTILTPASPPLFLTSRSCSPSQRLTSSGMCRLALAQIKSRTSLPTASSFWAHHQRNHRV